MSTISKKVINKINKDKLLPMPRWQFLLRDGGMWLVFGILILLVIASIGLLIYFWSDGPWLVGGRFGYSLLFGRMPIILLVLFFVGGFIAWFDFKNIGRGYRYPLKIISLVLLVLALLAGWLFNYSGLSKGLDSAISRVPFYQDRQMYMMQVWQNPDNGLIAGQITNVMDNDNFYLTDFNGQEWLVDASTALWRHNLSPAKGLEIKLIGKAEGSGFKANEVRPWMGAGGCGQMNKQGSCGMMR